MKPIYWVVCAAATVMGCSVNSSTPTTAWGKKDVTMINYRTDGAECAVLAATTNTGENGANTAGGISGSNASVPQQRASGGSSASAGPSAGASSGGAQTVGGGGMYRDSGSADLATRAAMQQQSAEMAANRARSDRLKSCLVSRGYTEFSLNAEQRAKLATLPQGSDERRDYLYKLGTDPAVLEKQAVAKKPEPAASASNSGS
jgi:hypothetical protein